MTARIRPLRTSDLPTLRRVAAISVRRSTPVAHRAGLEAESVRRAVAARTAPAVLRRSLAFVAETAEHAPVGLALATDAMDPMFEDCATGLLQILLLDPAAPPDTAACLIRHVAAAARGRWLVLRADVTSAHRGAWPCFDSEPWHLEHVSVRKKLPERPAWPSVPDGLILRPAGGKDREFVGALFDEATRAAMPTLFESLRTPAQIVAGTERAYRAILDDRPLVLIAERAGERLGHAIASVEVMNETNGRREGILHDVFVLDEHRDRGLSRLLTAAVEALSTEAGERYLIATVTADSPTDRRRLLGLLSGKGWVEFSRRFVRRLSESAGR